MSKSVLIVDEDPEVLTFLTHLLEARKLRVLRARSKSEALEVLGRGSIAVDLVLANLMTAQMDGRDFCRRVAEARRGVSVIYMTAFVDAGVIRVEAMNRSGLSGFSGVDERGLLNAVVSTLAC